MPGLSESHAWCRDSTRRHSKSFYFASFPLPKEKRQAAYAVYAFCRHADDLVDEAGRGADVSGAVRELESTFDAIIRDGRRDWPFAAAFADAVERHGLTREPFAELVEGVGRDQGRVRIQTWEELRDYCYHVASVVGLIMCPILGLRDPAGQAQAIDLGIAMQLTNIIRDVGEDLDRDRIYLPEEELIGHGLDEAYLRNRRPGRRWREFLATQIARARDYYQRGEEGIPLLAPDGSQLTVRLMRDIYADILLQVEKIGHDSLNHRAFTPFSRKIFLAAAAWRKSRQSRT